MHRIVSFEIKQNLENLLGLSTKEISQIIPTKSINWKVRGLWTKKNRSKGHEINNVKRGKDLILNPT